MASPNIKDPSAIYTETDVAVLTATLAQIVLNPVNSGQSYKINLIKGCNVTSGQVTMDVTIFRSSSHFYQCKDAGVDAAYTLIAVNRDEYFWLEEGDAIYAKASTASAVNMTVSYERFVG